ncbi:MAG: hypothetical protein QXL76_00465 [Candidatus Rehaiarchaeum fermentans]|nr:hypothetical protein [Candidatus Rehaiarchaeum fermentans]
MKSQALSLDLVMSLSILFIVLAIFIYFIYSPYFIFSSNSLGLLYFQNYINNLQSSEIANQLLTSTGLPSNWYNLNCTQINQIGLLNYTNNEISYYKLKKLFSLPLSCVEYKEGLNNFGIKLLYLNNSPFYLNGNYYYGNIEGIGINSYAYIYPNNTMIQLIIYT